MFNIERCVVAGRAIIVEQIPASHGPGLGDRRRAGGQRRDAQEGGKRSEKLSGLAEVADTVRVLYGTAR